MQIVGLVTVFSEQGSCLLCLLDLPCPELPFGSLTVQEPAPQQTKLGQQLAVFMLYGVCARQ